MVQICFYVERKKDFSSIAQGTVVRGSRGKDFAELLSIFTDHRPKLLPGEQLADNCKTLIPGRKGVFISSDCFNTKVATDGAVSILCEYETTSPDGARIHSYFLNVHD